MNTTAENLTSDLTSVNEKLRNELQEQKQREQVLQGELLHLRTTLDGIEKVLSLLLESRDPYMMGYYKKVSNIAVRFAQEMGLSERKSEAIRLAAILSDVGMINIPHDIPSKPGRLMSHEMDLIRVHPKIGHDYLMLVPFEEPIPQIVLQHHENYDGSGYPSGLAGDQILVEARILAVATAIDSMDRDRPYRPALGLSLALKQIGESRGMKYDPEVVDVCMRVFSGEGGGTQFF
jgi:HD-GYP domain-containing protein (c-di-GMP phosphodiesterase class II)